MISSVLKSAITAVAIVLAASVIGLGWASPTGGPGGSGGVTILPQAQALSSGTVLDLKQATNYPVTGLKIHMPHTSIAAVSLSIDDPTVPLYTYVLESTSSFVLQGSDVTALYNDGVTSFQLAFTTVDGLTFRVEVEIESATVAGLRAVK